MRSLIAISCLVSLAACGGPSTSHDDASMHACDQDGDGHDDVACGGDDCDDLSADRHPGAIERCDDLDQDCDRTTFGASDADGDGFDGANCAQTQYGYATDPIGGDCDDTRADTYPRASELCDGLDQDCDGRIDEAGWQMTHVDVDGDGFPGTPAQTGCESVVVAATDCDDTRAEVHPGRSDGPPDACNGRDDDCNGVVDDDCACTPPATAACGPLDPNDPSGATLLVRGPCRSGTQSCDGARWGLCDGAVFPTPEQCTAVGASGVDEDCDGIVDEWTAGVPCACATYSGGGSVVVNAGAPASASGLTFTLVSSAAGSATIAIACSGSGADLGTYSLAMGAPVDVGTILPDVCIIQLTLDAADATHAQISFAQTICG